MGTLTLDTISSMERLHLTHVDAHGKVPFYNEHHWNDLVNKGCTRLCFTDPPWREAEHEPCLGNEGNELSLSDIHEIPGFPMDASIAGWIHH